MTHQRENRQDNPHPEEFFTAGGAMKQDAPSYIERPADRTLYNAIRNGQFCYILTPRQMGKSSLMVQTAARLQEKGVRTAIIDLTRIGSGNTADQWYFGLLSRLHKALKLTTDLQAWWQERQNLPLVLRFTSFLREVVVAEIPEKIVIFIDEIDYTLGLGYTDEFFAAIRAVYNSRAEDSEYERLTFVLLGVATPPDLIKDRSRTPFNIGQQIDLREFTQYDADILFKELEKYVPENTEAIFSQIFGWTNGHPFLTQRLCLEIAASNRNDWDVEAVDKLVFKLFLSDKSKRETNLQFIREYIASSPQKEQLVKLYGQVYRGEVVNEEERSEAQNQLKLIGLLQVEDGSPPRKLFVRNKVYREAFNQDWIDKNLTPPNKLPGYWLYGLGILAVLVILGGLFAMIGGFDQPTPTAVIANITPTENPIIQPSATPENTLTDLPAQSPQPTDIEDTPEPTLLPTLTPPTATETIIPTETPTPTSTAVPPTESPTATVVPPTAVPPTPIPAPQLLSNFCNDQIITYKPGDTVPLEWSWNGRLLNNEYLEVRVGARDAGDFQYRQSINIEPWRYGVPIQELVALYPDAKSFEWRIVHMAANRQTEKAVSVLGCFNSE